MDPISQLVNGLLGLLTPIITPDWGQLIALIPLLLVLVVALYLAWLARTWMRFNASLPAHLRPQLSRSRWLVVYTVGVALGGLVCVAAFQLGGKGSDGTLGLYVNTPLLLAGLLIAIGVVGHGILRWEHDHANDEPEDAAAAWVRQHGRGISIALQFAIGVLITAAALLIPSEPDAQGVVPVAVVPLLIPGLLLAIFAIYRVVAGAFGPESDGGTVAVEAGSAH